jgi:hypothetical protein
MFWYGHDISFINFVHVKQILATIKDMEKRKASLANCCNLTLQKVREGGEWR